MKFRFTIFKKIKFARVGSLAVICLAVLYFIMPEVAGRLYYELHEIANWDTGIYYAIGKGLSNGISPYSGLYENKPPMIFFLAALSYKLTSGYYLVNILSFLSFITVALLPAGYSIYLGVKKKLGLLTTSAMAAAALGVSLALTSFAELRSGEVQIEIFGSAALLISFLAISLQQKPLPKFYSAPIVVSGIFLGIATMFKEPFFLIGLVSLFFFVRDTRSFLYHVLIPVAYASLFSLLLLIVTKSLIPYFTIYLANMFGSHLSIYGSPWERANNIFRIFDDIRAYSRILEACVYLLIAGNLFIFIHQGTKAVSLRDKIFSFAKVPWVFLCLYAASFIVGLGGQYYNHHHIFALPFYGILIFNIINYAAIQSRKVIETYAYIGALIVLPLIAATFADRPPFNINQNVLREIDIAKENAAYIDKVLDTIGEDRYLFLGFNGYHPYAYTRHDAIGPAFVQDAHNFTTDSTFFSKAMTEQFQQANLVVFKHFNVDAITQDVILTLNNCFTKQIPPEVEALQRPVHFHYDLHFRIHKDCSFLK